MLLLSIELVMTCPACSAPVAINACVSEVQCDRCRRTIALSKEAWALLLNDPVRGAGAMVERVQAEATIEPVEGVVRRLVHRESPRCRGCRAARDVNELSAALSALEAGATGSAPCPQCAFPAMIRHASVSIPNLAGCFDEEADAVAPEASTPAPATVVDCPKCGGALTLDGTTRLITCHYCAASVQLSDEVWARVHPTRPVRAFCLIVESDAKAQLASPAVFVYSAVQRATADAAGNVYVIGSVPVRRGEKRDYWVVGARDWGYSYVLWSFDRDFKLRWLQHGEFNEARLALHPNGALIVWSAQKDNPQFFDTDTGQPTSGELGYSLSGVLDLLTDSDGTVVRTSATTLDRFTAEGKNLPLFNPKTTFWHGLTTSDDVDDFGAAGGVVAFTPSGHLFLIRNPITGVGDSVLLRRYLRNGDVTSFTVKNGSGFNPAAANCFAASDTVILASTLEGLVRFEYSAGGISVSSLSAIGSAYTLLPDKSLLVLGSDGAMARFSSDLRKIWENAEWVSYERRLRADESEDD